MTWLLALTLLMPPAADAAIALRLTSGETIIVDEEPVIEGRRVIFKVDGRAFSLSRELVESIGPADDSDKPAAEAPADREPQQLRVDAERASRLFEALSRPAAEAGAAERGETPPPRPEQNLPAPVTHPPPRTDVPHEREESYWRARSRSFHENLIQARETLALLTRRERRLNDEILGMLALGYDESYLGRQAWQLQNTRDDIEFAALEIKRAERALADFQAEARREGVYPGWLRY